MTPVQEAHYVTRIAACREAHQRSLFALEERAATEIALDLRGLALVSDSPIRHIEGRWLRWLDANIVMLDRAYARNSERIQREVEAMNDDEIDRAEEDCA